MRISRFSRLSAARSYALARRLIDAPGLTALGRRRVGVGAQRHCDLAPIGELEETITAQALETEYDQVLLGRIFVERNQANADDSAGEARASHILYQPEAVDDEAGTAR